MLKDELKTEGCLLLNFRRQALELSDHRQEGERTEEIDGKTVKTDRERDRLHGDTRRILQLLETGATLNGVKGGVGDGGGVTLGAVQKSAEDSEEFII